MALRVYNTLSKQKENFEPVEPGKVRMYVCGPTVYKPSHLGHMVGPVIFDTIKRYLTYCGYDVTLVINITDIDDKLIIEAAKQNTTVPELARRITADYCRNLEQLNVTGIDHLPRATDHIPQIQEMIQGLIDRGYAYPAGGDVYFDVSRDPDYGKLCHRDPEQLKEGARIEVSDKKRNPGDFALWKGAKPGEPFWESPWGPGRPGWHIECSAMSMTLLGKTLDMHGGGLDLQFPHHENELAQSESYTGETFVRYWLHNGLLKIGDKKMAKSEGNEITVHKLLERHHPETIRFFLLSTHYRRPIDYTEGEKRLEEVRRGLDGFYRFFERFERITGTSFYSLKPTLSRTEFKEGTPATECITEVVRLWNEFLAHMDDDFNTGGAIGVLYELLKTLNRFADERKLETPEASVEDRRAFERGVLMLKDVSQILGVFQRQIESKAAQQDELTSKLMQMLIEMRNDARKNKDFKLADQIRDRLAKIGVVLEDRKEGTLWRRVES